MKLLDPKAVWLFFIQYTIGTIFSFFFFGCFLIFPIMGAFLEDESDVDLAGFVLIPLICFAVFTLLSLAFSYVWAKLSYSNYKYELTEDGFRKESGVIFKKYVTIPYERIQNVDIYRGIFARMLDLSDLQIQTAGMSYTGKYGAGAEGRLPGLHKDEAEAMRDELIKRAKGSKNDGV